MRKYHVQNAKRSCSWVFSNQFSCPLFVFSSSTLFDDVLLMDDLLGDEINGEDEETHEPGPPTSQVSVVAGTEEDYELSESLEEPDVVVYRIQELYGATLSSSFAEVN